MLALLQTTGGAAAQSPKPNIIYILADDLGASDVGFRTPEIRTPSIDALAKEGAVLTQFYVQPMCTPTRAALMTGRYPMRYGLQSFVILPEQTYSLPMDERLLPQVLKSAGYSTAIVGKWHLGHSKREFWPNARGFDYQYGAMIGEIDYFTRKIHGQTDWYRNGKRVDEPGYVTELIGKDAVKVIERHNTASPLFMYLAFTAPHTPYQVPKEALERFKSIADPNRRAYVAMISVMDQQIGNVLKALEKKGMRDNTLIIFHSDNGGVRTAAFAGEIETKGELPASNAPYRDGKGSLYEGGTRVVALANWPKRIKPGSVNEMIHVVDMLPTLAGIAGASLNGTKPLDGINAWPSISEGKPSARTEVVYNIEMFRGAVRNGDWKLIWRVPLPSKIELFNITADPEEKTDLSEKHPEKVVELRRRIDVLAGEMAKSLFMGATFRSYLGRHAGPPVFPNEDGFFMQH